MIQNIQLLPVGRNTSHVCYFLFVILSIPVYGPKSGHLSIELCVTDPSCGGAADGLIRPDVSGGGAPYTYHWNTGSKERELMGVGAGTYSLTVTDCDGRKGTAKVTICEPESIVVTIVYSGNRCSAPVDITTIAEGGKPPYTYEWSNGVVEPMLNAPDPGTYEVTVTDSRGCQVTEITTYPGASDLEVAASLIQYECGDDFGTVSVVGLFGVPPYTFGWSNGDTSATAESLQPGREYLVTVTDAVGCSVSRSFPVVDFTGLSFDLEISEPDCGGDGFAMAVVKPPVENSAYDYNWSNGATGQSTVFSESGAYSVTVYDRKGCGGFAFFNVRIPTQLNVEITSVDDFCNMGEGRATVVVSGGTPPYQYLWDNGETRSTIKGLFAGTYMLMVKDAKGCEYKTQVTINGSEPLICTIQEIQPVGGPDMADGRALVEVEGGTPPYTYAWSNGQTDAMATGLSSMEYSVTITDVRECTVWCSIKLTAGLIAGNTTKHVPVNMNIYPIPFNKTFYLELPEHYQQENVRIRLQRWSGQTIQIFQEQTASPLIKITPPDIPPGMYLIRLEVGEEKEQVYRLIKN